MILVTRSAGDERWKTVRIAVTGGWGTTLRYALIISLPSGTAALVLLAAATLK